MKRSPRLRLQSSPIGSSVRSTELHATGDKAVMEFDVDEARRSHSVVHRCVLQPLEPDAASSIRLCVQSRCSGLISRRSWQAPSAQLTIGLQRVDVSTKRRLPMDSARIAFRDIARADRLAYHDSPACFRPGRSTVHQAPLLVVARVDARAEAFLLGVMSSIPFDWVARRWVELTSDLRAAQCASRFPSSDDSRWLSVAGRRDRRSPRSGR